MVVPATSPSRPELLGIKLRALVGGQWGPQALSQLATFPGGAAGHGNGSAWVLADRRPERSLGPALAWARQAGADHLHLLVEAGGGSLARRASAFAAAPQVWWVRGRALDPAGAEPLSPSGVPASDGGGGSGTLAGLTERLVPAVRAIGADLVAHPDGTLRVEVLGLEVARMVRKAGVDPGSPSLRLEVGVGHHDRQAHRMVAGHDLDAEHLDDLDGPAAAALDQVVTQVRSHRRAQAPSHPANQLAPERWLRAVLVARPDLVGASSLAAVELPTLPSAFGDPAPAAALGTDGDGGAVLVVCSTGVDLDLVPAAADARLARSVELGSLGRAGDRAEVPRLVLALPAADDLPVTRALAAALAEPAEVRPVPPAWRKAIEV